MTTNNREYEHRGDIAAEDAKSLQERIDGILNSSEIVNHLNQYTAKADRAKRNSTICGLLAILLGSLAIVLAAIEITTEVPQVISVQVSEAARDTQVALPDKAWPLAIGFSAALSGLASLAIASIGLLFSPRKQEWLRNRFRGERIRQFHYQTFIYLLPQIAAYLQDGTKQKQEEYENQNDNCSKNSSVTLMIILKVNIAARWRIGPKRTVG